MGARQRGQARRKNSSKNSPQISQKKLASSLHVQSLDPAYRAQAMQGWQTYSNSSFPLQNGFSLSQEARNTESHGQSFAFSTPLRGKGISFVSAGTLKMDDEPPREEIITDVPREGQQVSNDTPLGVSLESRHEEKEPSGPTTTSHPGVEHLGIEEAALIEPAFRERVSSSSTESSEEIVFLGRQKKDPVASKAPAPEQTKATESTPNRLPSPPPPRAPGPEPSMASDLSQVVSSLPLGSSQSYSKQRMNPQLRRRVPGARSQREMDEEEAIMQDYIDNLAMNDRDEGDTESSEPRLKNEHHRFHGGAGEEHVKVQTHKGRGHGPFNIDQAVDWNSEDLEDFDDISTTDEEIMEVAQVLRKRQRTTGTQYLVSGIGMETSDAKWILHRNLTSTTALKEIQIFEEIQMGLDDLQNDTEQSSTDSEEAEALDDLIDQMNSEDNENAHIMRHTARMSDEQIARALAKQEELGLGGDEVLLFDGQVDDDADDHDVFAGGGDFISFSMTEHTSNRSRSKRNKRASNSFPSAGAFADALDEDPYGAFDVMDFDRPSLKPKRKGRKGDFPYDLDGLDEDLAETMRSTWMKDREKKALRKREKAEAGTATLLESSHGNSPDAIKRSIKAFLVSEGETLSLPVMEAHMRASVHRLAKALHLNSRSVGKGDDRHPTLTKTPRTEYFSVDTVWEIDAVLNQSRFFPRNTSSYKNPKVSRASASGARARRGGGGIYSGASYMDGDVVGASAPEIGSENKGRAMLEKMGWSSGMGIGAVGNEGATDVIKHVVKNTKAGLG